jgi:hypothetical protein
MSFGSRLSYRENERCARDVQIHRSFASLRMTVGGMSYLFLPSSAMYTISCLKMKRFGPSSRVTRTIFLS